MNAPEPVPRDASASSALLRLISDNVPAAIAYYDASTWQCLFANNRYAQTFGWTTDNILGHTFADVIGEAAAREIDPQVQQVLKQRASVTYERQLDTANGMHRLEVNLL